MSEGEEDNDESINDQRKPQRGSNTEVALDEMKRIFEQDEEAFGLQGKEVLTPTHFIR